MRIHCLLPMILASALGDPLHPQPLVSNSKYLPGEDRAYWLRRGQEELDLALSLNQNTGVAKNIILFIGDGMSLPTVAAARTYKGQKNGNDGDGSSAYLSWESFPNVGLSKTYSADYMVPDSAATATAMYTGVKTTGFTLGLDGTCIQDKPSSAKGAELETILDWAQAAGKKTGFVTTTRMSHATPAALYAKTIDRFWEGDKDIKTAVSNGIVSQEDIDTNNVKDITRQLIENEPAKKIDIMFGGGLSSFLPESQKPNVSRGQWDYDSDEWDNYRQDGRDLIQEWKDLHPAGRYIESRTQLGAINPTKDDHVMGIFTQSYISWDDQVEANDTSEVPRLNEMSTAAVKFLQAKADDRGFFIMIEGGRIDAAHHNGQAVRALHETVAFDKAIGEVLSMVNLDETLVIVTADHSHTMTIGGYSKRTNDITSTPSDREEDNFTMLSYGNGPGFKNMGAMKEGNWTAIDRVNVTLSAGVGAPIEFRQASAAPLSSETHGGDDVGIWAVGPWAHLVHGVHEQSYIATVMQYAGCLGRYSDRPNCITEKSSGVPSFLPSLALVTLSMLSLTL